MPSLLLALLIVLVAIGPAVAQTPGPQATDSGGAARTIACQGPTGPPGGKITWTFTAPNQICTRFFPNAPGGRGTYTFIGGDADIVTVTPRTGTSGNLGSTDDAATVFTLKSGTKTGQTTLTLRYNGPSLSLEYQKRMNLTVNWTVVIVNQ